MDHNMIIYALILILLTLVIGGVLLFVVLQRLDHNLHCIYEKLQG